MWPRGVIACVFEGRAEKVGHSRDQQEEHEGHHKDARRDLQVMGMGHDPDYRTEQDKSGWDGNSALDHLTALPILCELDENGQASKQNSQNKEGGRSKHATYLRE